MSENAADGHEFHAWGQYPEFCAKCRAEIAEYQADTEREHAAVIDSLTANFAAQSAAASKAVYDTRHTLAELTSPKVYDIELAEGAEGTDALADLDAALRLLRNVERIATWRRSLYPATTEPITP